MTAFKHTYERYWTDRLSAEDKGRYGASPPNEILESVEAILGSGTRLLDVGCGNGALLGFADAGLNRLSGRNPTLLWNNVRKCTTERRTPTRHKIKEARGWKHAYERCLPLSRHIFRLVDCGMRRMEKRAGGSRMPHFLQARA